MVKCLILSLVVYCSVVYFVKLDNNNLFEAESAALLIYQLYFYAFAENFY